MGQSKLIQEKINKDQIIKKFKKFKNLPMAALISMIGGLSSQQIQQIQTLLNMALRTIGEQKIRQVIRTEIKKINYL